MGLRFTKIKNYLIKLNLLLAINLFLPAYSAMAATAGQYGFLKPIETALDVVKGPVAGLFSALVAIGLFIGIASGRLQGAWSHGAKVLIGISGIVFFGNILQTFFPGLHGIVF